MLFSRSKEGRAKEPNVSKPHPKDTMNLRFSGRFGRNTCLPQQ